MTGHNNFFYPVRRASIIRTKKYIAVFGNDSLGGGFYFLASGYSSQIPNRNFTIPWLGAGLRNSLVTSQDNIMKFGIYPFPPGSFENACRESAEAERSFWFGIRDEYGFKDHLTAMSKSALVFASWKYDKTDQICLESTRGRGAGHSAWYEDENQGKVFHVSINVTDEDLGAVALQALDACQPNYA